MSIIKIHSFSGSIFCLCGASMSLTAGPEAYGRAMAAFQDAHQGEGHGRTTKEHARKVRRDKQRAEEKARKQAALL